MPQTELTALTALPKSQQQILRVLVDGRWHSYRDIVKATGKYSNLPAELRERHPRSLGSKGLVRENLIAIGNEKVSAFQITTTACKLLDLKPAPEFLKDQEAAVEDFKERFAQWRRQYQREEQDAKKLRLRHNPYLLLRALADGQEHGFADLARATGIFSGLPQDLRSRHARHRSLASLGLIRETFLLDEDKSIHAFVITPKGLKLLDRLKAKE